MLTTALRHFCKHPTSNHSSCCVTIINNPTSRRFTTASHAIYLASPSVAAKTPHRFTTTSNCSISQWRSFSFDPPTVVKASLVSPTNRSRWRPIEGVVVLAYWRCCGPVAVGRDTPEDSGSGGAGVLAMDTDMADCQTRRFKARRYILRGTGGKSGVEEDRKQDKSTGEETAFSKKKLTSSLFFVMLRLLSSSSPTVASSVSSAPPPTCLRCLKDTRIAAMFRWKSTNQSPVLRHLFGEDLGRLSIKELEQLEQQLDSSLRQIRSRRTQSMLNQLSQLQVKVKKLLIYTLG
ncbi:hypothetical protein R6Q59_008291 [Mikania micrantha]